MLGLNLAPRVSAAVSGSATAVVARAVDVVYDFVARDFFANYQRWCPQVVELEPNECTPMSPGLMARQVTLDRGIRSESTFEIVEVNEGRRLALEGRSEPFRSSYNFENSPIESTTLTFQFELLDLELSMRPFAKLIRAAIQEGAEQTVENIKRILESGAPVAGSRASPSAAQ